MAIDKKISQLGTVATPARTDVLTVLDPTTNKKGTAADYLALTKDSDLQLTDITTNDVSIAKHGFAPKAPNDTTKFLRGDATWASVGLLGFVNYNPNPRQDVSTTSTTGADVDATNLAVTFTVPASGRVLVGLKACAFTAANSMLWCLRDTSGNNISGTAGRLSTQTGAAQPASHRVVVSGLTPGASLTYRWGQISESSTAHTVYGESGTNGSTFGPAVMEVWAA